MQVKKQQLESYVVQQIGKPVNCHPAYLTYMQNAGLDESQSGIKIAGRNIKNLRYVDDTTLMAESK